MTTIIFVFLIAFVASLTLTPAAILTARRFAIVDLPRERKVHSEPIPRLGGVALFFAFFLPFLVLAFNEKLYVQLVETDYRLLAFIAGGTVIFGLGLWDDIHRLPSSVKFAGQVLVGTLMYAGGIGIHFVLLPFVGTIQLGILSLPATVFWFVLVINAINLIDGLDGLAAGIALFVSFTMLIICLMNNRLLEALGFASLAGSLLGFLRYNFNPATIFMGDSGSYFLGYILAAMSILGSIKGQFATAMLIPVIALGVPLIDTLVAPIRRFILGQKMFQPDSGHLHHRLLKLGYTQRRAVLLIYACTVVLGGLAILLVHARDEAAAVVLLIIGSCVFFLGRIFGLQPFLTPRKIGGWLHEVSDVSGFTQGRRSFLNLQLAIVKSRTTEEMWQALRKALDELDMDFAELVLYREPVVAPMGIELEGIIKPNGSIPPRDEASLTCTYTWNRNGGAYDDWLNDKGLMKIEHPLLTRNNGNVCYYGTLVLVKDLHNHSSGHYMLTRIEHLRRTLNTVLEQIHAPSRDA